MPLFNAPLFPPTEDERRVQSTEDTLGARVEQPFKISVNCMYSRVHISARMEAVLLL